MSWRTRLSYTPDGLRERFDQFDRRIKNLEQKGDAPPSPPDDPDDLPASGGGGKPYASLVIAASNSTAADRAMADYVCDGTADEVEIQAALDAVDTAGIGGKVLLLEGTFTLASGLTIAERYVVLEGMGFGTVLDASSGSFASADLLIISGLHSGVRNMRLLGQFNTTGNPARGVWIGSAGRNFVTGLYTQGFETAIHLNAPGGGQLVADNHIHVPYTNGIYLGVNGNQRWHVARNTIQNPRTSSGAGINCQADFGIISDNIVWSSVGAGISLNGDNNFCTANLCDTNSTYGIVIGAAATNARVAGNFLRNNTTAPLLDSGTSSQLTWPAHATYGDNFS